MIEHKCWHCTNVLIHRGLVGFGGKRFIRYDCAACKMDFAIEKKDASLVIGQGDQQEIDNESDIKPIITIVIKSKVHQILFAEQLIERDIWVLTSTKYFVTETPQDTANSIVLDMHNIFRSEALYIDYPERELILVAFARSLGINIYSGASKVNDIAANLKVAPKRINNVWGDQLLIDLVGIPVIWCWRSLGIVA